MHSSRMCTRPHVTVTEKDPPRQRPPLDRDPLNRDPLWTETPWTETDLRTESQTGVIIFKLEESS